MSRSERRGDVGTEARPGAGLTTVPALISARTPASQILQSETA
jgi:hypothetical protein